MTHFSWLSLLPIYLNRVTPQLPSASFSPSSLCSPLSSPVRPDFSSPALPFHLFSLLLIPSLRVRECMCGKNPALGLHCLFHVRTSGDIKGPLRGLSVCISSALTVSDQDPGILDQSRARNAACWRTTCLHPPAVIVHMHMHLHGFLKPSHPSPLRQINV